MARWVVGIPGSRSLKTKRSVVRGLRDRLRARFKVSAAETGHQDNPRRAELAACFVASDYRLAESMIQKLDDLVCSDPRIEVHTRELDVLPFGDGRPGPGRASD